MLPDKLRSIFRTGNGPAPLTGTPHQAAQAAVLSRKPARKEVPSTRQSRGLEQFFFSIRDVVGLSVLDCAGANQENINFLIDLGHKVYTQDLVRNIDEAFGSDPTEQANVSRIDYFLRQNFDYPSGTFDGALMWDSLQFMSPALLNATVERLHDLLRPNAYLLAFFTADERATQVPSYRFRIADNKTVVVSDRGVRGAGQVFNNRNLEKLFNKFDSVKFFLTRENLREIIVRR